MTLIQWIRIADAEAWRARGGAVAPLACHHGAAGYALAWKVGQ